MVKRKKISLHTCEILIDLVIIYICKGSNLFYMYIYNNKLALGKFLIPDTDNIGRILSL